MADFAKRSEVTIQTMGKVHNPSGEGVRPVSAQAQAKFQKSQNSTPPLSSSPPTSITVGGAGPADYETKTKEGTAKRNITRKKTDSRDSGNYDSRNKKQGGHGKGKWKDDELINYEANEPLDEKDPLYDEVEAPYVLGSHQEPVTKTFDETKGKPVYGPMLTLSEFKIQVQDVILEYFDSCDTDEVTQSIDELQCREYHMDVVKKIISMSLDKSARERELISRLLTCLHPAPLSDEDMQDGFNILLDSLDDLTTDVPDARTMVGNFLARAVVDEVLPPAYLSEQNNSRAGEVVIEKAIGLLTREHSTARLEKVWGPGDGRPVEDIKVEMDQLLEEYLLSRELDECARCVKELDVRFFMHELVKRGVRLAMEFDGKDENTKDQKPSIDAMAALFGFLVKNAVVSERQVRKGVDRLHRNMVDMQLDIPAAPQLLQDFENILKDELPASKE